MREIQSADLTLFEHDPHEKLIGEIPRHPIGYVFIIFNAVLTIAAILVGLFFAIRYQDSIAGSIIPGQTISIDSIATMVAMILVILVVLVAALGMYIYRGNYIVLTDQKLVLITMKNIIARKVSQLSIGDVQDVTIDQNTLFSRIFHYGTINIETAGEQANFSFPYAQNPHECSKAIVDAHENNLKLYGN